jgi:hypothetical protein
LRTYCRAAAWISSLVTGGSKLASGRMFRHMAESVGAGSGIRAVPRRRTRPGAPTPAGALSTT